MFFWKGNVGIFMTTEKLNDTQKTTNLITEVQGEVLVGFSSQKYFLSLFPLFSQVLVMLLLS